MDAPSQVNKAPHDQVVVVWWKLETGEGLWQEIVKKKYVKDNCIAQLQHKASNSPVWNDLLKVRVWYLKGRRMLTGDAKMTDFWEDTWCGETPLKREFPQLFEICREQKSTVDYVARRGWRLSFRRWLDESKQNQWRKLRDRICTVPRSENSDTPKWAWNKNDLFSVKSVYSHMCAVEADNSYKKNLES